MTSTTTRRAVLAGAASLPALAATTALANSSSDAALLELGERLQASLAVENKLYWAQHRLRDLLDALVEKIRAQGGDDEIEAVWKEAQDSPEGLRWRPACDEWFAAARVSHMASEEILWGAPPSTLQGLAVLVLAAAYQMHGTSWAHIDYAEALVLRAAIASGNLQVPSEMRSAIDREIERVAEIRAGEQEEEAA
jgi:hypothetical protein